MSTTNKVTKCEGCGRDLTYKTRKPQYCAVCKSKNAKPYQKPKPRKAPKRSKKEAHVQRSLNLVLPEALYIDNGYYSWLISPRGFPMQLDRYYPELKLAIEVQGRQHYAYNKYFHASKQDFEYLQECDRSKAEQCKDRGIKLIAIRYDRVVNKDYLIRRFTDEGIIDYLRQKTKVVE